MAAKVSSFSAFLFSGLAVVFVIAGCGGGSSNTGSNTTATPTFSPGGGTYTSSQPVTISDATSGAVLYCTTDGTTPTSSSPKCSQPTTVYQTEFLQAIAVAPGKSASAVASAGYVINLQQAPTPTFTPAGGTYTGAQQVTISDSLSGANIYYTLDGSTPTQNSPLYTGPVTISQSLTLNAIAFAAGYTNSIDATAAYTIQAAAAVPTIGSLSPSSVTAGGAAFQLTINGTNFDAGSLVKWGSTALTTTYVNATQLTAQVPASLITTAGSNVVTVTTSAGASAYAVFIVNPALPVIASLTPSSIAAGGGDFPLTVTGSNFDSSATVNWNGSALPTTNGGATSLSASVPGSLIAAAGTASVTVKTSAGTSNSLTFTITSSSTNAPTVTGVAPASGKAGDTVTITGTNFTNVSAVNFGSTPATSFTFNSATSITAVAPAGPTGTVDVTVVTPNGTSAIATADQFTYTSTSGPSIKGFVLSGTGSSGLSASVQLYAAGNTNYGPVGVTGATNIGSAQTDATTGAFAVSYSCPQAPGDQLYLVATGVANSQVVLMTALGSCGSLQSGANYTINEATTVASAYALQQFMAADGSIGALINDASSLSYTGLSNAFKTVNNLVDRSTGTVRDHTPDYTTTFGSGDPNIVNNSTVPQARINTLANALNACVSNSSSCGTGLFAAATVGGTAPANTLQAILNIAQNPGNKVTDVYNVASSSTAYTPSFTGPPNDWTIALTFTGGGLGVAPSISGTDKMGNTGVGPVISTSLAIDANGNVFVAGFGEFGYPSYSLDIPILAEFNNLGAPQTQVTSVSSDATPVITFGDSNVGQTVNSGFGLSSVAIDTSGNIWAGDLTAGGALYVVSPSTHLPLLASQVTGMRQRVLSLAIDNNNNAWVGINSGFKTLQEYSYTPGNATLLPGTYSGFGAGYTALSDLIFDSGLNLWGYNGVTNITTNHTVDLISTTNNGSLLYNAFPSGGSSQPISLAADGNGTGNVYGCGEQDGITLDAFNASPSTTIVKTLGSRGCGEQLLLDGAGHLFAISNGFVNGFTGSAIDEYTTAGAPISPPANGYTGTSSAEQPTITIDNNVIQGNITLNYSPRTGAIDGSGNLWLVNLDTSNTGGAGSSGGSNSTTGNVLVEFIGIAAPVVTPTSAAVANGQLGVRP